MSAVAPWQEICRDLDWKFSYVSENEVFPEAIAGKPWRPFADWQSWEEPFKTSYADYVATQQEKDASVFAVCEALGRVDDFQKLDPIWLNALKLHTATLPLAEFAATVGNLRATRFGRTSNWRNTANFAALDEFRHTQIPLFLMHKLVKWDPQFDWVHKFYHSKNWVAVAARHFIDELLVLSDPIEFSIGTNFVFETGFTNLQFIGLSAVAKNVGDKTFEKMVKSIQTDEARHAQIGPAVLELLVHYDKDYAQHLLDKWFWRSWLIFAIVTGFSMDYLTPLASRKHSFKEFMEEWILEHFLENLERFGLKKPWYWETFLASMNHYHHMVYASAYTYRATVWFDMVVPSPEERNWLAEKYPESWSQIAPVWERIDDHWRRSKREIIFNVHGMAIVSFCNLCQIVLSGGSTEHNTAIVHEHAGQKYIFCSEPCRWIFTKEPDRYQGHKDLVKRVLAGEAPGNVLELITKYFGLTEATWGKDAVGGAYPWLDATVVEKA